MWCIEKSNDVIERESGNFWWFFMNSWQFFKNFLLQEFQFKDNLCLSLAIKLKNLWVVCRILTLSKRKLSACLKVPMNFHSFMTIPKFKFPHCKRQSLNCFVASHEWVLEWVSCRLGNWKFYHIICCCIENFHLITEIFWVISKLCCTLISTIHMIYKWLEKANAKLKY